MKRVNSSSFHLVLLTSVPMPATPTTLPTPSRRGLQLSQMMRRLPSFVYSGNSYLGTPSPVCSVRSSTSRTLARFALSINFSTRCSPMASLALNPVIFCVNSFQISMRSHLFTTITGQLAVATKRVNSSCFHLLSVTSYPMPCTPTMSPC